MPTPRALEEALLRRARDLAGGVSFLSRRINVKADDLDAMIHGYERIPAWVFLRAVDFLAEAESLKTCPPGFPSDWQEQSRDTDQ